MIDGKSPGAENEHQQRGEEKEEGCRRDEGIRIRKDPLHRFHIRRQIGDHHRDDQRDRGGTGCKAGH